LRILFKTSYLDDIRLLKHSGYSFWYGVLVVALVVAPALLAEFYVGELSQIFVLAIAGVGLMLLIGYTGLASLGHGAFMAIGAYTDTYLITKGVPFPIAFVTAGLLAMVAGIAVALPANRMTGIYLAIATLAFSGVFWTFLSLRTISRIVCRSSSFKFTDRLVLTGGSVGSCAS